MSKKLIKEQIKRNEQRAMMIHYSNEIYDFQKRNILDEELLILCTEKWLCKILIRENEK